MIILTIFILALSMSMDAFSLSLIYGTIVTNHQKQIITSLMVGLFHFFMPLLGNALGQSIINTFHIPIHIVLTIILIFIGVEMIFSSYEEKEKPLFLNFKGIILFALAVSMDSLTLGTGISAITNNFWLVSSVFLFVSSCFTYIGLKLGQKINECIGKYSTLIGGILLIIVGIFLNFS